MRLSEFTQSAKLISIDDALRKAQSIVKTMLENGDMKLVTNDNMDMYVDKYLNKPRESK